MDHRDQLLYSGLMIAKSIVLSVVTMLAIGCGLGCEKSSSGGTEGTASAQPSETRNQQRTPTRHPALLGGPRHTNEQAPDRYTVKLETTKGDILIDVHRDWAPRGADRFYNLVRIGYYDDVAFFRVISGFMAQVGIHGDSQINDVWREARIQDDPPTQSNTPGMVSFATAGPNTRTTQFFINFGNNSRLDGMGFAPFGRVRDMSVVNELYAGYGEGAPQGRGPLQGRIQSEGNSYLRSEFPQLDYIRRATIE